MENEDIATKPVTRPTSTPPSTETIVHTNGVEAKDISPTRSPKLQGYEFYRKVLGSPQFVVAPMVDQSELAWRMLCRKYGAQLCYSPMFHSNLFAKDVKYRKDALQTCPEDRPLIIQFCGNDAETLLDAALLAQEHCDAVDINLGCPQAIAKRGHYGAFLQDDWELITEIVNTLHKRLSVPVTCKIRVFEDRKRTIEYAKMLEASGCQLLTVHGRTREQKGPLTGIADWTYIKEEAYKNSNVCQRKCPWLGGHQALHCRNRRGGCDDCRRQFTQSSHIYWKINENLGYCKMNLRPNSALREELAVSNQLEHFRTVVDKIKSKYEPYHLGAKIYDVEEVDPSILFIKQGFNLSLPPWLCQPYIRLTPETHKQIIAEKMRLAEDPNRPKRQFFDIEGNEISRKRMKKLRRRMRRPNIPEGKHVRSLECCSQCANPVGNKCEYRLCRTCCRDKCYSEDHDCLGHGIMIKSRIVKSKLFKCQNEGKREYVLSEDVEDMPVQCSKDID
ncbi:PREDICTED: tRNA-dihydrouridine(16/17) synthase [NAD(P)(+)]-like isoform X3 [Rhagoletis zephyria]|uniref:tRNA-dihydrouridine(16/17) synthase [NAD(P)(+)]-like isoform X3 n=1 Tax=Rhagoletis zephyria TaxID=28612 RepID=UPI0008112BBC|nr:PREDICTED: tRNA-dihydrouridine(16/17) synthase [NAD(P)(+)]-like isoform X3 [Rhagoletis zephyria]